MRLFFDTSVLIAAMVESHPAHTFALPWLQRIRDGADTGILSAHSLAELYAILTRLPLRPRIGAVTARRLIQQNVLACFEVVSLSQSDYAAVIDRLADLGVVGGAVYDAVIMQAAARANPDQVITLNPSDFRRVCPPELVAKLVVPGAGE
jgi:predicted nucleic acid-binding protein